MARDPSPLDYRTAGEPKVIDRSRPNGWALSTVSVSLLSCPFLWFFLLRNVHLPPAANQLVGLIYPFALPLLSLAFTLGVALYLNHQATQNESHLLLITAVVFGLAWIFLILALEWGIQRHMLELQKNNW